MIPLYVDVVHFQVTTDLTSMTIVGHLNEKIYHSCIGSFCIKSQDMWNLFKAHGIWEMKPLICVLSSPLYNYCFMKRCLCLLTQCLNS